MAAPLRYNVFGIYFSSGNASGLHTGAAVPREINRVQNFTTDLTNNLIDINQFGNLAALARLPDTPDVTANIEFYPTNGGNEKNIGLVVSTGAQALVSCVSGILNGVNDTKNIFASIVDYGAYDAAGYTGPQTGCIGLGNAFLSNYTVEGAVDGILTATTTYDCLNTRVYASLDGTNTTPAVTTSGTLVGQIFVLPQYQTNLDASQVVAIQDYGMVLTVSGGIGLPATSLRIQNFSLSIDLSREAYSELGARQPYARPISFPAPFTLSVDGTVDSLSSGSLNDLQCNTGKLDATLLLYGPSCPASGRGNPVLAYYMKGASLNTQNFSVSITDPLSATFELGGQIGAANDNLNGVFISGTYL